jgi:type I restriction enzyme S subunit
MSDDWTNYTPAHWRHAKLKHIASLKSGESITSETISERGSYPVFGGNGLRGYTEAYTHSGDHVLIGRQGALCGNINYASGLFWASEHAIVVTPKNGEQIKWLGEMLRFLDLNRLSQSAAQPGIAVDDVANLEVVVPPPNEQHAIADYLNRETARLDALVASKERLLGLLAEKRRALITHAVTRGLNPNVRLRNSRIAWLSEIPTHWETERSRWLFQERDERSTTGEEELLTVSHLTGVTPRSEKDVNMFEAETTEGYKICLAGDLVINTLWAWMGAMGVSSVDGIVSPAYNVYRLGTRLDPGYVDLLVRIPLFAQEVIRYSKGVWSSRLRLYPEGFFEVSLPVPPLEEQRDIVNAVTSEIAKVDGLTSATSRSIALLKERRAALIAATVTGQLAITEVAE